jgi:hypothetical protein
MEISVLFKSEEHAAGFQNSLLNIASTHIHVEEDIEEVHLSEALKRVLHFQYDGADNNESPALSLADIKHVQYSLSSDTESVR